jgi:hypothetical protein
VIFGCCRYFQGAFKASPLEIRSNFPLFRRLLLNASQRQQPAETQDGNASDDRRK